MEFDENFTFWTSLERRHRSHEIPLYVCQPMSYERYMALNFWPFIDRKIYNFSQEGNIYLVEYCSTTQRIKLYMLSTWANNYYLLHNTIMQFDRQNLERNLNHITIHNGKLYCIGSNKKIYVMRIGINNPRTIPLDIDYDLAIHTEGRYIYFINTNVVDRINRFDIKALKTETIETGLLPNKYKGLKDFSCGYDGTMIYLFGGQLGQYVQSTENMCAYDVHQRMWFIIHTLPHGAAGRYPVIPKTSNVAKQSNQNGDIEMFLLAHGESCLELWRINVSTYQWTLIYFDFPPMKRVYYKIVLVQTGIMYVYTETQDIANSTYLQKFIIEVPTLQTMCRESLKNYQFTYEQIHSLGVPKKLLDQLKIIKASRHSPNCFYMQGAERLM